uniref:Movement protein n=1 Tax=Anisakis simplex TaxID=6269 RepID=A0A0M3JLW3_ANISI
LWEKTHEETDNDIRQSNGNGRVGEISLNDEMLNEEMKTA